MPRYLVKHYFWVCWWGCFWKSLAFELVDQGKKMALTNVDGHHLVYWRLNRRKSWKKGELALFVWSWTLIFSFLQTLALVVLEPLDSDWDSPHWLPDLGVLSLSVNYTIGFPIFPGCRWQTNGVSWPLQSCKPVPIINLLLYLSTYLSILWLCLSGEFWYIIPRIILWSRSNNYTFGDIPKRNESRELNRYFYTY